MLSIRSSLAAIAGLTIAAANAGAQSKGATLYGVVVDSAGRPLDAAEIELIGAGKRTLSGADGTFRFERLSNSRFWLAARRIGYRPYQQSLTLEGNEQREVKIVLAARPLDLPEIVVRGENRRYQARMSDFLWRSRASFSGRFLTRDDIARVRPSRLGDLVIRYMPFKSMWVMDQPGGWGAFGDDDGPFGRGERRFFGRTRYRPNCPPAVALNGGGINVGWAVNDFEPSEVEALEVYREGTQLPIEYDFADRAACGLVVVWLKSYAQGDPAQR